MSIILNNPKPRKSGFSNSCPEIKNEGDTSKNLIFLPGTELKTISNIHEGNSCLYLTFDKASDSYKVLKTFSLDHGVPCDEFQREKQFCSLKHPNIIKIFAAEPIQKTVQQGEQSLCSHILMEYAPYGNFQELIEQKFFLEDERLVRTYFCQLIKGLQHLQANGLSHLDLKCENLLLGEDGLLKITDFDLSCKIKEFDCKSWIGGTENYRAPELIDECAEDPVKADIYSAGIILFMMQFGQLPFKEVRRGQKDLYEVLREDPDLFWSIHPVFMKMGFKLSQMEKVKEFKQLFVRMVDPDPSKRPSFEEILESPFLKSKDMYIEKELPKIISEKGIKKKTQC